MLLYAGSNTYAILLRRLLRAKPGALVQEVGTVFAPRPATSLWTALYLAAVGTVAPFFLYNWILLSTVLAVLLGVAVLDETFEWQTVLGSLVAVLTVGISIGARPETQSAKSLTDRRMASVPPLFAGLSPRV